MNAFRLFFLFIRLPLDYVALLAAAFVAYVIRLSEPIVGLRRVDIGLPFEHYMQAAAVAAFLWLVIFVFSGLYSTDPNRKFLTEVYRILIACSAGFAAVAVLIFLRGELFNSRFIVLAAWILAIVFVFFERLFVRLIQRWLHAVGIGNVRVVVIGDDAAADVIVRAFTDHPHWGNTVVRIYKAFTDSVARQLESQQAKHRFDEFIFTNADHRDEALRAVSFCEQHHITFKYAADLFATYAPTRQISVVHGVPLIELQRTRLHGWGRIIKRTADIIFSLLLIIVLSPLMIAVAMLVYIETGSPILFKNTRVGLKGEPFHVLKFRTMYQKDSIGEQFAGSSEALERERRLIATQSKKKGPIYKVIDDPRVTPVGRILRRWSIDELPQLFNVLFGSMSMVGPRPHQPREVAHYESHHKKVFVIKPGITGLAQISGRSDLSFEEEIQLDTFYIEQWSLLGDLFIVLKTPWAIIKKDGAY